MANLKRNMIELVKEVKEGEIVTEKYLTPVFIPLSVVYEGLDLADQLEKSNADEKEKIERLVNFIADEVYGKQFTKDDLKNGLHGPQAIETLHRQLVFATNGFQDDETKKFLAKKN